MSVVTSQKYPIESMVLVLKWQEWSSRRPIYPEAAVSESVSPVKVRIGFARLTARCFFGPRRGNVTLKASAGVPGLRTGYFGTKLMGGLKLFSIVVRISKNFLILGGLVFLEVVVVPNPSRADQCQDPSYRSLRNSLVARHDAMVARLKSSGDCSTISDILAFGSRANAQLNTAVRNAGCDWNTPNSNAGQVARTLRQYCRSGSTQASVSKSKAPQAAVAQQQLAVQSTPSSAAITPTSGSCSDITGTGGGPSAPCVRVPGWKPTEPFNHARTPVAISVVQNHKVVQLTIPGLDIGKFGLWLDDGVLSVQSWNNMPAPSHVDVDVNKCPAHTAWKGWTEPRCEELTQKAELSAAEISERFETTTANRCQSQGGTIFSPNEGAITEDACLVLNGKVITPFDNESRGWCPTTKGCWDGSKWTKIIDATSTPRCKMKYGSHEPDCRAVIDQ